MSSMDVTESNRFADPVVWLAVFVLGLFFYVFAYPVVLFLLAAVLSAPLLDTNESVIGCTVIPLDWLYETVPVFGAYIDPCFFDS